MTKISALSDIGTSVASNDAFVLVDVSDPTTPNKKIQQQNLLAAGGLLPDGSAGTPGLRFTSDTNVGLFRPTTDTLGFATGGSERLRIDSSGRVGIGTSSPINTLHVNGTGGGSFTSGFADALALINATTNTAGQGAALALTALATKETAWIISAEHTSGNNGDLAFYGYPGGASYAERMRITSAGNVGIGTASPVPMEILVQRLTAPAGS
jgi:trimeric autotransporter adhesin